MRTLYRIDQIILSKEDTAILDRLATSLGNEGRKSSAINWYLKNTQNKSKIASLRIQLGVAKENTKEILKEAYRNKKLRELRLVAWLYDEYVLQKQKEALVA